MDLTPGTGSHIAHTVCTTQSSAQVSNTRCTCGSLHLPAPALHSAVAESREECGGSTTAGRVGGHGTQSAGPQGV